MGVVPVDRLRHTCVETLCGYRQMGDTVTLYRPVGPKELELLEKAAFRGWPPRLPEQPIFYPVTNRGYAREIASQWNVKASGAGFVARFEVRKQFMQRYEVHTVGARRHREWWIPAEDLEELNDNIVGPIEIIDRFGKQESSRSQQGD